jgi:hypothetical protein
VRAPLDGTTSETSTTTWGDGSRRRQEDDGDEGRIEEVLADDDGIRRPRRATSSWWRGAGCHANSKPPPPPRHSVAALATLHETHDLRSAPEVPWLHFMRHMTCAAPRRYLPADTLDHDEAIGRRKRRRKLIQLFALNPLNRIADVLQLTP